VADTTEIWAAIAAGASAVAAIASWWVARKARLVQESSADFSSLLEVSEQIRAAEARVHYAKEEDRTFEFNALLNCLEAIASLHNDGNLRPSTRKMIGKYLIEVLTFIRNDEGMKRLMEASITSGSTYEELEKFGTPQGIVGAR